MKKLFFTFLLSFLFIPSTFAVGEICGVGTDCCNPPAILAIGGGCQTATSGRVWIGPATTGSCEIPPASCPTNQYSCSTGQCIRVASSGGSAPDCKSWQVHVGNNVCKPKILTYEDSTNDYKLWNNGVVGEPIYMNSDGKVGIGTDIPEKKLHILDANPQIRLAENASNYWDLWAGYDLHFQKGGDTKVALTGSGDVGIGRPANSVGARLDVQARSDEKGALFRNSSGTAHSWIPWSNGEVYLTGDVNGSGNGDIHLRSYTGTSYTDRLIVEGNTGNVGIGTASPAGKLHIKGGNGTALVIEDNDALASRPGMQFKGNFIFYMHGDDVVADANVGAEVWGFFSKANWNRTYDAAIEVHGKCPGCGTGNASWGKKIGLRHDGTDGKIYTDVGDILLEPGSGKINIQKNAAQIGLGDSSGGPHGIRFQDETANGGMQLFYRTSPNRLIVEKGNDGSDGTDLFYIDRDDDSAYFHGDLTVNGSIFGAGTVPVGGVVWWWCPMALVGEFLEGWAANCAPLIPSNFKLADGSLISDARSPFNGYNSPDAISRYPIGTSSRTQLGVEGGITSHQHQWSAFASTGKIWSSWNSSNSVTTVMDWGNGLNEGNNSTAYYPIQHSTSASYYTKKKTDWPAYVKLYPLVRIF